jgi:hypothetical protein
MTMGKVSATIILPAALQGAGNAFAAQMGWQVEGDEPGTFNMAVTSGDGITHWGTRAQIEPDGALMALVADPPEGAEALVAAMILDVDADGQHESGGAHFDAVLADHGLARWAEPEAS